MSRLGVCRLGVCNALLLGAALLGCDTEAVEVGEVDRPDFHVEMAGAVESTLEGLRLVSRLSGKDGGGYLFMLNDRS